MYTMIIYFIYVSSNILVNKFNIYIYIYNGEIKMYFYCEIYIYIYTRKFSRYGTFFRMKPFIWGYI